MNLKLSGVGAEPKKLAILGLLVAIAAYFVISNRTPEEAAATPRAVVSPIAPQVAPPTRPVARSNARSSRNPASRQLQEFRPSLRTKDIDPSTIDPTLRLDLLAKLKGVNVEGAGRSLFQFSEAPPEIAKVKEPGPIQPKPLFIGPPAPKKEAKAEPPPEPKAPPIPLKFYGFIHPERTTGPRRAFFLDGDDIVVATEGDVIKKRYKIVRIGINSAVVEDLQFEKAQNKQQTLPLVEEQAG